MPTYIGLIEYTQQGIENFEEHAERVKAGRQTIAEAGGEPVAYYDTMGQYDAVAVAEFPTAETALMNSVIQAKQGDVRIETLRTFDETKLAEVIGRMT